MRTRGAHRGPVAAGLLLALLLVPVAGRASPFEVYGFGAPGLATAGAQTAETRDYHAVYYNPAQVLARKRFHVGLGVTLVVPRLNVERARPESAYGAVLPETNVGLHLGVSGAIGGPFKRRLGLAVGFYLPLRQTTRMESLDPRSPQAYLHQSLPDKMVLGIAVAYEPVDGLRIGAGVQTLAGLAGTADVEVSVEQQRVLRRSLRVDFFGAVAPTAGLAVDLVPGLTLAFAYRGALDFRYSLPIRIDVAELGRLSLEARGVSLWDPHTLDFGGSYRVEPWNLTVSATLTWALWSQTPSPASLIDIRLGEEFLGTGGGGDGSAEPVLEVSSASVSLGARDILIPRLGVAWSPNPAWTFRTGYAFRPTPLPDPVGAASYLDADTHIVGLGAAFTFGDPLGVHDLPLTLDLAAQWQHVRTRTVHKRNPADETGDLRFKGDVFVVVLEIHHDF